MVPGLRFTAVRRVAPDSIAANDIKGDANSLLVAFKGFRPVEKIGRKQHDHALMRAAGSNRRLDIAAYVFVGTSKFYPARLIVVTAADYRWQIRVVNTAEPRSRVHVR